MPKLHKRIPKTSELMWIFGTVFMALGVCLNKKSDLGVSMIAAPTFILQEFLSSFSSFFSAGVTEYLLQGVILIVLFIVVRKFEWRFLLCFVAAIIYGYCLDLWLLILGPSPFQSLALRWVMLIVGDLSVSSALLVLFFALRVFSALIFLSKSTNCSFPKCLQSFLSLSRKPNGFTTWGFSLFRLSSHLRFLTIILPLIGQKFTRRVFTASGLQQSLPLLSIPRP